MEKYPKAQLEFEDWFSTEARCVDYLNEIRWPEGFRCPRCNGQEVWKQSRLRFTCPRCRYECSAKAGTFLEGTNLSLRLWYRAIWWLINQKSGVSAAGLQKGLGLGSYRTAWLLLHKIRAAMVTPNRKLLKGRVEIDEVWVGGKKRGLQGRNRKAGPMIIIAVEVPENTAQLGRIRIKHIKSNSSEFIHPFVLENIEKGSHLQTDLWGAYRKLEEQGFVVQQTAAYRREEGEEVLRHVNLIASLLKNWLQGTHQGRWSTKHLQPYLDEFVFRFNRRTSKSRGLLFRRVLEAGVLERPLTYNSLTSGQNKLSSLIKPHQVKSA